MKHSRELRDLVLGMYRDWSAGDPSFVDELFSHSPDVTGIGTDPEEWSSGAAFREGFKTQISEAPVDAQPGELIAFSEGTTGWVVDNPTVTWDDTTLQLRLSLFFHRENGAWRAVHSHVSVGISNEEAIGFELTTSIDAVAETVRRERPPVTTATTERTVTIVFTDIESSTELNERLGDARWRDILKEHIALVDGVTAGYGGETVERAGDGFMLAFPAANAALRCAVELQRELRAHEVDEAPIQIRIGAHTGEPIREAETFYGRDVAFAARVASVAQGGEILVSSVLRELVRGAGEVMFDEPREAEFKGFDGAQKVHPVRWS